MKFFPILITIFTLGSMVWAQEVDRLVVLPLQIQGESSGLQSTVAKKLTILLRRHIANKDLFSVQNNSLLKGALKREKIAFSTLYDLTARQEPLHRLSRYFQYQIEGEMQLTPGGDFSATVRLIQTENAQVLKSAAILGSMRKLDDFARTLVPQILPTTNALQDNIQHLYKEAFSQGNYRKADKLCTWALQLRPKTALYYYQRGMARSRIKGGIFLAHQDYQQALASEGANQQKIKAELQRIQPEVDKILTERKKLLAKIGDSFDAIKKAGGLVEKIELADEVIQRILNEKSKDIKLAKIGKQSSQLREKVTLLVENLRLARLIDPSKQNNQDLQFLLQEITQVSGEYQVLEKYLLEFAAEAEQFFQEAEKHYGDSNYKEAMRALTKAFLVAPDQARLFHLRGLIHGREHRYDEAIADLSAAISKKEGYWQAYYNRGHTQLARKKYSEALSDFQVVLHLQPDHALSHFYCGEAYNQQDKHDDAFTCYSKAIELDSSLSIAYFQRGKLYDHRQEYLKAQKDYQTVVKKDPKARSKVLPLLEKIAGYLQQDAKLLFDKGKIAEDYGEYKEAIEFYGAALTLHRDFTRAYFRRAISYQTLGAHEKALADYREAIALERNSPEVYFYRAICYQKQQKFDQALNDLNRAIELEPGYHQAYHRRGGIYEQLALAKGEKNAKGLQRALNDYGQAIRLARGKAHYYLDRARIYKILKKYNKANLDRIHAREIK